MSPDMRDAVYVHWPIHHMDPTAYQLAERLHRHFHTRCEPKTDWNRSTTTLRIVAPHAAVVAAVELYLAGKQVAYTITREAM